MVWWLFSRKKEGSFHPHIKKIEGILKNSFENIKNDVYKIIYMKKSLQSIPDHIVRGVFFMYYCTRFL